MAVDVLVYSDAGGSGGAERWVATVGRHLRAAGYAVAAAHPPDGAWLPGALADVGVASVPRGFERLASDGPSAPGLVDRAEPSRLLADTAARLVLFSDSTPLANLAAKEVARDAGVPYLSVTHASGVHPAIELEPLRPRLRGVCEPARHVVGVSSYVLGQLRQLTRADLPNALVVFNGVAAACFDQPADRRAAARASLGIAPDQVVAISVGRLDTSKGFPIVLEVLRRLPADGRLTWLWVGGGATARRAKAAAALRPGPLRILGERDDVPTLLGAADLFVLPTHRDSFCLAAVEAMAAGLPVAVSDVAGMPEVVEDAAHLLPDPNGDPEAAVAAIATLVTRWMDDPDERAALGARGRDRADRRYREDRMGGDHVALVAGVIGPPGSRAVSAIPMEPTAEPDPPLVYEISLPRVLGETIDAETVLIDSLTGAYYALDEVGSHIWSVLRRGPASAAAIGAAVAALYGIERDVASSAVGGLLHELHSHELLRASAVPAAPVGSIEPLQPGPLEWRSPSVERFNELEDLLLLDPIHDVDPDRGWPITPADG